MFFIRNDEFLTCFYKNKKWKYKNCIHVFFYKKRWVSSICIFVRTTKISHKNTALWYNRKVTWLLLQTIKMVYMMDTILKLSKPLSTPFTTSTDNQELKLSTTHLILRWLRAVGFDIILLNHIFDCCQQQNTIPYAI